MLKKHNLNIENIPAILWGEKSDKLFIAVHGNMECQPFLGHFFSCVNF